MDKLMNKLFGVSRYDVAIYSLVAISAVTAYDGTQPATATVPPLFLMLSLIFANVCYMRTFDKLQKLRTEMSDQDAGV